MIKKQRNLQLDWRTSPNGGIHLLPANACLERGRKPKPQLAIQLLPSLTLCHSRDGWFWFKTNSSDFLKMELQMRNIISGKSSFFPNIAVLPRWVFCFHHDLWIPLETHSLDVQKAHIHPGPAHWEKTVVTLHTYTGLSLEKGMLPSPLFLPQKSHGQRSLAGYRPRGRKESDKDLKTKLPPPHTYNDTPHGWLCHMLSEHEGRARPAKHWYNHQTSLNTKCDIIL